MTSTLLVLESCKLVRLRRALIRKRRLRNLPALCCIPWNRARIARCLRRILWRRSVILVFASASIRLLCALCLARSLAIIRYRLKRCNLAILRARANLPLANNRSFRKRCLALIRRILMALLLARRILARRFTACSR